MSGRDRTFDVVLVGGGLAAGLCALALRRRWPRLRLAMCEAGPALGGNHTWSFFGTDVDDDGATLLEPMVVKRWDEIEAVFPDHRRRLATPYASVSSAAFDRTVRPALATPGSALYLGRRAVAVGETTVVLDDGHCLEAALVLDARGPGAAPTWVENQGFQKFVGLEVEIAPHPRLDPGCAVVMDARVEQQDGFRFVYTLPLSPTRLLVEDTYYADAPTLDRQALRGRVLAHLDRGGFTVNKVVREEAGVLPLPWSDDSLPPLGSPLRLGARGGWFHPTTGYSLPLAVRVAQTVAKDGPEGARAALARLYRPVQEQARFARRLNRLLFRAAEPASRWQVLSRFYRLPQPTIERFYQLATTPLDRARILFGRPPEGVAIGAAFSALQVV